MTAETTIPHHLRNTVLTSALEARTTAYAPYSKFHVGASLLLASGEVVPGANVENASYGAGICAERTALTTWATTPAYWSSTRTGRKVTDRIVAVAVSSDRDGPCSPCGICRQFIREFCTDSTPILMVHSSWTPEAPVGKDVPESEAKVTVRTLGQLLPLSFGPEDLDQSPV